MKRLHFHSILRFLAPAIFSVLIILFAFGAWQGIDRGSEQESQPDEKKSVTTETNESEAASQMQEFSSEKPIGENAAQPLIPQDEVSKLVGDGLDVGLSIKTTYLDNDGIPNNGIAYNGERVTYTIGITNTTQNSADSLELLFDLPPDTFRQMTCLSECEHYETIIEERTFPDPLGGSVTVTVTRSLLWNIPPIVSDNFELQVVGLLVGQSNGVVLNNRVSYRLGNVSGDSDEVQTEVRVRIGTPGQANLSSAPTWFSSDLGGTLSQDWADFDLDGDLDLVLGSSAGAAVYEFDEGRLHKIWDNYGVQNPFQRISYGVRWGNFLGDQRLEFVTIGATDDGTVNSLSTNRIYQFDPDSATDFTEVDHFTSDKSFVRVEAGDLNGDNLLDLVVSTNSINASCPVRFYRHNGNDADLFNETYDCLSTQASANISLVDKNNDDQLDLMLGFFESQSVRLFSGPLINDTEPITERASIVLDNTILFLPYDFAWGDYDGDGDLDLAAAYPLQRKVLVYANLGDNEGGNEFDEPIDIRTSLFRTPLAVDWGDFDGDGKLDLLVNDMPPKFYKYESTQDRFREIESLSINEDSLTRNHQLWAVQSIDQDNDGDLDLAIANRDGPSFVFTIFAPRLATEMTQISQNKSSNRVAWGDANGDGWFDLVFAATDATDSRTTLHFNQLGDLSNDFLEFSVGFGPHSIAFGDMNEDSSLDLVIGSPNQNNIFSASDPALNTWQSGASSNTTAVAWGDMNDDRKLDLLIGNENQALQLYLNQGDLLSTVPAWTSNEEDHALNIAWGDYNNDYYLDFAVANEGQSARVYRNNGVSNEYRFTLVWSSPHPGTTDVAWGDVDGDGNLDLAVAYYDNEQSGNAVYKNLTGNGDAAPLSSEPFWEAKEQQRTTSLAWADFDNDGDVDLAVGNHNQPDQVYVNEGSTTEIALLEWLWQSSESYATTDLAWGDRDRDGDLDLAVSTGQNNQPNGIYLNHYILPSHLSDNFVSTMPLPNNPSYVTVARPGKSVNNNFSSTDDAYFYSSPEILSGQLYPIVEIKYNLYDPDGTRSEIGSNAPGDEIAQTFFDYSLDGGGSWQPATQAANTPEPLTQTLRLGQAASFFWNAQADAAISDNARFRVRIVPTNNGSGQQSSTSAISPPFRVRGLTCVWPRAAIISINPDANTPGKYQFIGQVLEGTGSLTFEWDFGDGSPVVQGQVVNHTFSLNNIYTINLTVIGEACPITRPVYESQELAVDTLPFETRYIYLPLISQTMTTTRTVNLTPTPLPSLNGLPRQVSSLQGKTEANTTTLRWQTNPTDDLVEGYRIYRASLATNSAFELLAKVAETQHIVHSRCGYIYYVTAFNQAGESPVSSTSYALPACQ